MANAKVKARIPDFGASKGKGSSDFPSARWVQRNKRSA